MTYRNYNNVIAQEFLNELETNLRSEEQTSTCVSCACFALRITHSITAHAFFVTGLL